MAEGTEGKSTREAAARAFGAENRARLLHRYFAQSGEVTPENAWKQVYRLLLWIDRTTGLAHCYESDKSQPGRNWYARSLAFHDWVSAALDVSPTALAEAVDWLYREAVKDLSRGAAKTRSAIYEQQRAPYSGRDFPEPGEDPELVAILKDELGEWLVAEPPDSHFRNLTRRIHAHVTQENKRKNLLGEAFEDTLAAAIGHLRLSGESKIFTRTVLHDLPGFHRHAPTEKPKRVDLALISGAGRTLISAKWSIRADREEQFQSDFEAYARLEAAGRDFDYVLVTNEFDAARLRAACERRRQNAPLFTHVVHLNPEAVMVVYRDGGGPSAAAVRRHIEEGRLISLETWLAEVVKAAGGMSQ